MKRLYLAAVSVVALSMAACDPAVEEVDNDAVQLTESQLDSRVIITQTGKTEVFSFTTSPSTYVDILFADDNSLLASGISGTFKVPVFAQGNIKIQTLNTNGEITEASKSFSVEEWELTDVLKTVLNNDFDKGAVWTWDTEFDNGAVWGNAGYQAGSFDGKSINGKWWGATNNDFPGQLNHSNTGVLTGEEDADAYMVFNRNKLEKYDASGKLLNSGTFSTDNKKNVIGTDFGYLNTSEGAILWPFKINGGGYRPTRFEIAWLSDKQLQLIYADEGTGGWSECTWWAFKKQGVSTANPADYKQFEDDKYAFLDANNDTIVDKITAVSDGKLSFSYVALDNGFVFKAQTIESSNSLKVPDGTTFVDITPANADVYEIVGKDTTAKTQTGTATFDALDAGSRYDVTVTYDSEKKKYKVYYTEFDKTTTSLSVVAVSDKEIFVDEQKKAAKDTSYAGEKSVSGSITTYTFKDITFKEGGNQFYLFNLKDEAKYSEAYDFSDIIMLKGDDKVFEAGSVVDGIKLIKLASSVKDPVTIVVSIYEQADGTKAVYMSAIGASK